MKFRDSVLHLIFWIACTAGCLVVAFVVSRILGISFDTALLIIGMAVLIDIQMEVDGIARFRRDIEDMIEGYKNNRLEESTDEFHDHIEDQVNEIERRNSE